MAKQFGDLQSSESVLPPALISSRITKAFRRLLFQKNVRWTQAQTEHAITTYWNERYSRSLLVLEPGETAVSAILDAAVSVKHTMVNQFGIRALGYDLSIAVTCEEDVFVMHVDVAPKGKLTTDVRPNMRLH